MSFHDVSFPLEISASSRSATRFRNSIIKLVNMQSEVTEHFLEPVYEFVAECSLQTDVQLMTLRNFFAVRGGNAHTFRFRDRLEYTSAVNGKDDPTALDVNIGLGNGTKVLFQLFKRYSDVAAQRARTITKPIAGTTRVSVNGTEQVSPGWSFPWSVNTTTGIITFSTPPPSSEPVQVGFKHDCEVRAGQEILDVLHNYSLHGSITIPLHEEPAHAPVEEEFNYRGSKQITTGVDISISKADGFLVRISPSAAIDAWLPPKAVCQRGGPHFWLRNLSGSNDVTLKDSDDSSTVTTLTDSAGATPALFLGIGTDSAGDKVWEFLG